MATWTEWYFTYEKNETHSGNHWKLANLTMSLFCNLDIETHLEGDNAWVTDLSSVVFDYWEKNRFGVD